MQGCAGEVAYGIQKTSYCLKHRARSQQSKIEAELRGILLR
jgi:hypothetical protein